MENLIGKKVIVNIKDKNGYTSDLYNSIQKCKGIIIKKQNELSTYKNAYLIEFGIMATRKHAKTHSGAWAGMKYDDPKIEKMAWWTEKENFRLI